jgi:hypothetical protein
VVYEGNMKRYHVNPETAGTISVDAEDAHQAACVAMERFAKSSNYFVGGNVWVLWVTEQLNKGWGPQPGVKLKGILTHGAPFFMESR